MLSRNRLSHGNDSKPKAAGMVHVAGQCRFETWVKSDGGGSSSSETATRRFTS